MIVDKLGVYETRGGHLVNVTYIEDIDVPYPVGGDFITGTNPYDYYPSFMRNGHWTTDGVEDHNGVEGPGDDTEWDLVKFLPMDDYPELYI